MAKKSSKKSSKKPAVKVTVQQSHKARLMPVAIFFISSVFAYISATYAIDRGSWWLYLATFLFVYTALRSAGRMIHAFLHR